MDFRPLPNVEYLRQRLLYEPESGILRWRTRTECGSRTAQWNARYAGTVALSYITQSGYMAGCIDRKFYLAHRIIWALYHGEAPELEIDHVNGIRTDNRISNLRSVSHSQNARNRKISSKNTSGTMGVNWNKAEQKWNARIRRRDCEVFLGHFEKLEDAVAARKKAEAEFGYHRNHGRLS